LNSGVLIQKILYYLIPFSKSKNATMRSMNAQYFEIILRDANNKMDLMDAKSAKIKDFIEKNADLFDYQFIKATEDTSIEVRTLARTSLLLYRNLQPQKC